MPERGAASSRHSFRAGINCRVCLIFSNDMGNPPRSPLLEHVPATAVMLDCLGHIFPFISPGTEMDVGQALQPGETPPCAAQEHLSRCASAPPIFTRPRRSTISLRSTFPNPSSPGTPKEHDEEEPGGPVFAGRSLAAQNCIS